MPAYNPSPQRGNEAALGEGLRLSNAYARLERLNNSHTIRVLLDDAPRSPDLSYSTLRDSDAAPLSSFCSIFETEMQKYSAQLLALSKIEKIALVRDLRWNDTAALGLASIPLRAIFFDISAFQDTGDATAIERARLALHHEVFHHVDVALNGPECFTKDDSWPSPSSPCPSGSTAALDFEPSRGLPGFPFGHAPPNVGEDKADIFSVLMLESAYTKVAPRLHNDSLLRAKFEHIRSLVQRACPNSIASGEILTFRQRLLKLLPFRPAP